MDKSKRIKYEISGILALVSGLIVFISLITHNQWDPSPFTYRPPGPKEVGNLLGIFGSYLSDTLRQVLGLTAYVIPLIFFIFGLRKILGKKRKHRPVVSAGVTVILMLSASSLIALIFNESSGGILGSIATRLSVKLLSTTGSYLFFIPLTFVALMFLVPFSVIDFLKGVRDKTPTVKIPIPFKGKKKEQPHIEEYSPAQVITYKQEPLPLVYPEGSRPRAARKSRGDYERPSLELLKDPVPVKSRTTDEEQRESANMLVKKLKDFSVDGRVTNISPGPVVTMFEFEPAPGIKINRVISLADDLALTLKKTSLRISPIPGKATLGIEVPNKEIETVFLKEILSSEAFKKSPSKLTLAMGKDIFGNPIVTDLGRMPHLLIAGTTGSGKSVSMTGMVLSLLYRATPREVKMLMIDPKMLEFPVYEGIPHLMLPIITSAKDAADALKKIVLEMEHRYRLLAEAGSRNIEAYNKKIKAMPENDKEPLPYLVIFIDEFADLMFTSAHEVENSIARLAQMARAAGIHLILATQRPSVDVITGVIKANFSSRISFRVSSKLDSRIILDTYGAEQLLGKGDMLFVTASSRTVRVHGPYITEEEIKVVVDFIRAQGSPDYSTFDKLAFDKEQELNPEDRDELYQQAKDLVLSTGQASISYIQRRMKIGYNRAASIMEMMEEDGIVSPPGEAGKPREVFRRRI
ncbi:MAG: DNA translocase FtsK 4TM domain-containing protein [Thermodesulfovibrionia bacterium]